MQMARRSAAQHRPMARRRGVPVAELAAGAGTSPNHGPVAARNRGLRGRISPARIGGAAIVAVFAGITLIGALSPSPVAGGVGSTPTTSGVAGSAAASSVVGAAWGGAGGLDVMDLVTKGGLVLILLFITLRVLGRMQSAGPRRGGSLSVIESRTLASKASLHLVAVGDRRLVVGLTPSGMVALAELDAAELEEAGTEAATAEEADADPFRAARAARAAARATGAGIGVPQAPFGTTLNSLMAPIDGLTDRLAGFFNGGRR